MGNLNVWVPGSQADANGVRAGLNRLGAALGYAAARGAGAGEGGMARMMAAIASGELTVLPIGLGDRERLAGVLAELAGDESLDGHFRAWCQELASTLRSLPGPLPVEG